MTPGEEFAAMLDTVQEDTPEWISLFGRKCLKILQDQGSRAVTALAEMTATVQDDDVKINCDYLLIHAGMPEAADAITKALDSPLGDEVLEKIFDEAKDSPAMRAHARFIAKARALYPRWPDSSLRDFLRHIGDEVE